MYIRDPNSFEIVIEWNGILAIACTYSARWMLAYYCADRARPRLEFHNIIKLLKNREDNGPYWFLEWIFAAYLFVIIIELAVGKPPLWPVPN